MVSVPHDHGQGSPSSEPLDSVKIDTILHKAGCKRVPEIVKSQIFNFGFFASPVECFENIPGQVSRSIRGEKNQFGTQCSNL